MARQLASGSTIRREPLAVLSISFRLTISLRYREMSLQKRSAATFSIDCCTTLFFATACIMCDS